MFCLISFTTVSHRGIASGFIPFDVPIVVTATTSAIDNQPIIIHQPPPYLIPTPPLCNEMPNNLGEKVVLQISSALPKFDTVGHKILSANHDFIEYILNEVYFSHDTKKMIILTSIKLAQMGDDMGSSILQQYYNIVDSCL
jgi:hypothetical protein